jgi:hypothetical protein
MAVAFPSVAGAATADTHDGEFPSVDYSAEPGETNHLTVSDSGSTLVLEDTGATIAPGDGCTSQTPSRVSCALPGSAPAAFSAYLGDGDDDTKVQVHPGGRFDLPDSGGSTSIVYGEDGDDTMYGSPVEEQFIGGDGDDTATGGGAADVLVAGPGDDSLAGGAGDDLLMAFLVEESAPAPAVDRDVFAGGAGYDQLLDSTRSDPQTFTFDGLANDGVAGEKDNVGADLEALTTGASADTVVISADKFRVSTGAGDDRVFGGRGDDTLHGGPGADWIDGREGHDWIFGGGGDDHLIGGPGFDHFLGDDYGSTDAGDDVIDSRDGSLQGDPLRPVDWIVCGGGIDRVKADLAEARVVAPSDGCENVEAPPDPLLSLITGERATAGPKLAKLKVRCPLAAGGTCVGKLKLLSVGGPAGQSKELASASLKLAPGAGKTLKLRLATRARKALKRGRALKARARVTTAAGKKFWLPGRVTVRVPARPR